jgi:hypothetical protein
MRLIRRDPFKDHLPEMWNTHPEFKLYLVSTHGKIKNKKTGRTLSQHNAGGYYAVSLSLGPNERSVRRYVHRLVLEAFYGKRPKPIQGNHLDGDKHNNYLSNLNWVTPSENVRHSYENLLKAPKIVTSRQVVEIRNLYDCKVSVAEIARLYKISHSHAYMIGTRRSWRHVR